METMGNLRRTHYVGELRLKDVGTEMTVAGSVAKCRNKGGIVFADLRDTTGILQLVFDEGTEKSVFEKAAGLKSEYVIIARGRLRERASKTDKIATGDVELFVTELRVLSEAETTPFEIRDEVQVKDELRLKYRYLDLRRPSMHQPLMWRYQLTQAAHAYYGQNHFVEIETPTLMKSTPEGARDYLVPSRIFPGKFFALPQSPQLYKQLLMLSGFDRYFQIARCYRDEDLRADRQPEFTQLDIEMSFVTEEDIMSMNEGFMKYVFKTIKGQELPTPFPRMEYDVAMDRYGSDKPDTRFGLELVNLTELVRGSQFTVFSAPVAAGGRVYGLNAKGLAEKLTRKEIDRLTEHARTYGVKGLAYTRWTAEGVSSSYEKKLTGAEAEAIRGALGAEEGDVLLLAGDEYIETAQNAMGQVRLEIARNHGLIDKSKFNFLWVVDFPLFEYSREDGRWYAKHHPFTMPKDEDLDKVESDPGACHAKAYDMVLNGCEIGGGSIRINNPVIQQHMFHALGFTEERIRNNFGFLVDAYRYGAPPHGGMAFGLDRLVMELFGIDDIRDVIAFPKVQSSAELMSGCPEEVEKKQLDDLSIACISPKKEQ